MGITRAKPSINYVKWRGYRCVFDGNFYALTLPVQKDMDRFYWFINQSSGPIDVDWFFEKDENETLVESYSVTFSCIENTSLNLFRPGMLSSFGAHLTKQDSQAVYFGISPIQKQVDGLETLAILIGDGCWPEVFITIMETHQAILFYYDSWRNWNMLSCCNNLIAPLLPRYAWSETDSVNLR